jgi:Concanavalin A-like lectin/glucanases superfamily
LYAYESVPSCVSSPAGLAGWWPGQGNANDMAGNNNGTLLNGATFAAGEVGSAFSFNGSNQCVQVPYSQTLVGPIYSVEAWVEPLAQVSGGINQAVIFGQSFGSSLLIARPGNSGVVILFGFGTSHVTFNWVVNTNEIPIGQFTHLIGTWDGTTLRLYVNGALNAQNTPGTSPVDPGCPFYIGGFYTTIDEGICNYEGQFFNGLIDEVSYYNRVLAGAGIQALYEAGSAGKCPPPLTNCVPPPSGLVSWWSGEGNGKDIMGTNNGAPQGGATFATGKVGQAFDFTPASGTVIVPDSPSLRLTNQLTIEAWINARTLGPPVGYVIVSKMGGAGGLDGFQFNLVSNMLQGAFNSPGQVWFTASLFSGPIITTGVWYHVAWTYDQSAMKLYCNGQLVASNVIGAHAIAASSSNLHISGDDNLNQYFDGLIDEPSVYNRALSDSEIAAIYNAGSAGKCRLVLLCYVGSNPRERTPFSKQRVLP